MGEDFGNAVKTNTAMQVINPEAGQEDMPPMALDGQKAEQALEQYRQETGEAETGTLVEDVGD
jgi:type IV pilus biogenesis protein CpaD/CtpE